MSNFNYPVTVWGKYKCLQHRLHQQVL
jgi:hypothetical protein